VLDGAERGRVESCAGAIGPGTLIGMPDRRLLIAIATVIALPILFAAIGGGRFVGIAIGVVLVAAGIGSMLLRRDHGAGDGEV
jgi:hypothetical protein